MRFYAERPLRVARQLLADVAGDRLGVARRGVRAGGAGPRRPAPGARGGADRRPGRRCATRSPAPRGRRRRIPLVGDDLAKALNVGTGAGDVARRRGAAAGAAHRHRGAVGGDRDRRVRRGAGRAPVAVRAPALRAHGGLGGGRARPRPRPARPPRAGPPADPAAAAGVGRPGGGVAARRHRRRARPRGVWSCARWACGRPGADQSLASTSRTVSGGLPSSSRGSGPRRRTPRPARGEQAEEHVARRASSATSCSRYWASVTTVRVIGLPVTSAAIVAETRDVGFGLANPGLYALMYGDPRPGAASCGGDARDDDAARARRADRRGREAPRRRGGRPCSSSHAAACGTVLTLLATAEGRAIRRCPGWPARPCWPPVIADAPGGSGAGPGRGRRRAAGDVGRHRRRHDRGARAAGDGWTASAAGPLPGTRRPRGAERPSAASSATRDVRTRRVSCGFARAKGDSPCRRTRRRRPGSGQAARGPSQRVVARPGDLHVLQPRAAGPAQVVAQRAGLAHRHGRVLVAVDDEQRAVDAPRHREHVGPAAAAEPLDRRAHRRRRLRVQPVAREERRDRHAPRPQVGPVPRGQEREVGAVALAVQDRRPRVRGRPRCSARPTRQTSMRSGTPQSWWIASACAAPYPVLPRWLGATTAHPVAASRANVGLPAHVPRGVRTAVQREDHLARRCASRRRRRPRRRPSGTGTTPGGRAPARRRRRPRGAIPCRRSRSRPGTPASCRGSAGRSPTRRRRRR